MVDRDILLDYTLRRSFRPPLLVGFPESNQSIARSRADLRRQRPSLDSCGMYDES